MCMVIKRDGRKVQFNKQKITIAILKAIQNTDNIKLNYDESINLAESISNEIDYTKKELNVEEIQDKIIDSLRKNNYNVIADVYDSYRRKRTIIRERNSSIMVEIGEKLTAKNVQNQNANVDEHSFGGRKGEADSSLMKYYALNNIMSERSKLNHINNRIYVHDLDSYSIGMSNCESIPFDSLLAKGFNTRQTDVRPANSVNTAFQLVAVIFQLQSLQQFGGVAATHLDWTMVPYIRKSFMKHYIVHWLMQRDEFYNLDLEELFFESYEDEVGIIRNKFDDWIDENKNLFFKITGLKESDFYFDNNNLDRKLSQQAKCNTITETQQAAEGMYHNLNTLQSRSGKVSLIALS